MINSNACLWLFKQRDWGQKCPFSCINKYNHKQSSMNNYYTYAYLREDRTPYYIGKGTKLRAYQKSGKPCAIPKDKSRIILLKQNLTEEESFKHEIYMIAVFGRKCDGGILCNKSIGGEGISGYRFSQNSRKKMSETRKGRILSTEARQRIRLSKIGEKNPFYGKTHSEETKNKLKSNSWKSKGIPSPSASYWKITFEDGRVEMVWGLFNWSKDNGYIKSSLYRVYQGKYKKHKDIIKVEKIQ